MWSESFIAYRDGDSAAARLVLGGMTRTLTDFFRFRTGRADIAEDLAQATILKIHFARHDFDRSRSLRGWVYAIAHRVLIDHWRADRSEAVDGYGLESMDDLPASDDRHRLWEISRDLLQAMDRLKPLDRSIVFMCGAEGCSLAEAAASLGMTEGAVKVRLHRARLFLQNVASIALVVVSVLYGRITP